MAELLEAPLMLVVTIMAATCVARHFAIPCIASARLGMGGIGLALLLAAEFGLVLWLRGLSVREYLATRDPVSGTVYYLMLVVFASMPLFVARR
jgi:type IV secretory pathway TrbD component